MFTRQTPEQQARLAKARQESAERMANVEAQKEAGKQRQQARDTEQEAFLERVRKTNQRLASGENAQAIMAEAGLKSSSLETFDETLKPSREAILAQREAEEVARRAAITPREAIIAALDRDTQQRIRSYEQIKGIPFPLEALGITVSNG